MKRKLLITCLTIITCLLFPACSRVVDLRNEPTQPTETVEMPEETTTETNTTEEETTEFAIVIKNKTEGTSDLKYTQLEIETNEKESFSPYYIYENNLFYGFAITDESDEKIRNKQIRKYNLLTGDDEPVYEFSESDVRVCDFYFNGSEFIWAQYTQYSPCNWSIYRMNIDDKIPCLISDYSEYNHRNLTHESVDLHIIGDSVFWLYNAMDDVNDTTLYNYDIDNAELTEVITLDARTVVFDSCSNGILTIHDEVETVDGIRKTYYTFDENGTEIDFGNELNAVFNSEIMVWYDDYKLYVRDLQDNQLYELEQFLGDRFYILDKYVITESEGIIRSYCVGEQHHETIMEADYDRMGIFDLNENTNELYCFDTRTKGVIKITNLYLEDNDGE